MKPLLAVSTSVPRTDQELQSAYGPRRRSSAASYRIILSRLIRDKPGRAIEAAMHSYPDRRVSSACTRVRVVKRWRVVIRPDAIANEDDGDAVAAPHQSQPPGSPNELQEPPSSAIEQIGWRDLSGELVINHKNVLTGVKIWQLPRLIPRQNSLDQNQ